MPLPLRLEALRLLDTTKSEINEGCGHDGHALPNPRSINGWHLKPTNRASSFLTENSYYLVWLSSYEPAMLLPMLRTLSARHLGHAIELRSSCALPKTSVRLRLESNIVVVMAREIGTWAAFCMDSRGPSAQSQI